MQMSLSLNMVLMIDSNNGRVNISSSSDFLNDSLHFIPCKSINHDLTLVLFVLMPL